MSKIKINKNIHNLLVAIGLSCNLLGYLLGNFDYGKLIIFSIIFVQLIFFNRFTFSKFEVISIVFTIGLFFRSFVFDNYVMTFSYFVYFIIFLIFSFFSISKNFNIELLMKYLVVILFISIPLPVKSFITEQDIGYLLGISYNFLPIFLIVLYQIFFEKKKHNIYYMLILSINLIVYSLFFVFRGNRGAILLIIIYVILHFLFTGKKTLLRIVMKLFLLFGIIFSWINIIDVLKFFNTVFVSLKINFYAFQKTINLLESNSNLDSGRLYIINKLFQSNLTQNKIIFGNGIGYIENELGYYSHNLIVQYFFEGGLIYCFLLLVILFVIFRMLLKENDECFNWVLIMFCSVILQLMLSNVYWLTPYYWILVHYIFNYKKMEGDEFFV